MIQYNSIRYNTTLFSVDADFQSFKIHTTVNNRCIRGKKHIIQKTQWPVHWIKDGKWFSQT